MGIKVFMKGYPVLTYYLLTFVISWGAILVVMGPGGIMGTEEVPETLMPLMFMAMLLGPSIAGLSLNGIVDGRAGFRELFSRLCSWRVGAGWYAVALLTAPLMIGGVVFALSLFSPVFVPTIFSTDDKVSLLVFGMVAGIMVGILEELGWTGFAIPRLRLRYGVLATGFFVGFLWGLWHFPLFLGSASFSGSVPPVLYVAVLLFSIWPVFRALMVWVYGRTGNLLVVMLMHASLTASTLILQPQATGVQAMTFNLVLTAALWVIVAVVAVANRAALSTTA